MTRRRIIRSFAIDYIVGADATYPGHQLVPDQFGERIKMLAGARREITYRDAEAAFALAARDYTRVAEGRGDRLRGRGGLLRWRADKVAHSLLSYVKEIVPDEFLPPMTGDRSLCEAMANAFGCGQREIEQAWSRRATRPKRAVKR